MCKFSVTAIYAYTASLTITGTQFSQNTANGATTNRNNATGGGAILMNAGNGPAATARIESSTFTQNVAPAGHGGALVTQGTTGVGLQLSNVTFSQNQAGSRGGALFVDRSTSLTAINSQFASNTAAGAGGGAAYVAAPYSFSNVEWKNNTITATGNGGALFVDRSNSGTIVNNLFEQNGSTNTGPGGAIFASGGSHVLVNTNLNRNAAQSGGAISADANITLLNCTLNRNQAGSGTAFSGSSDATFVVQNSLIWNNTPVANNFAGLDPSTITLQNSLIDPTATGYTDGGNNKTADPLFTNEAANDLTLTGCSPAINAGDNALYTAAGGPSIDLGGLTRPANTGTPTATVDMGAYEFQGSPGVLSVSITATPSLPITSGGSVTLTASGAESYTWSNGVQSTSVVLTNVTSATTLSVTGVTGSCSGTATVTVTTCNLTATIGAANLTICSGTGTTLTAAGGASFRWSTAEMSAAIVVAPTSTTAYQVTVTTGGCSATATATITVNSSPTLTVSPSVTTITGGQAVTLTASGGTNYGWSTGQSTSAIVVSPTTTTDYSVTATASGNCRSITTATVSVTCNTTLIADVYSLTQTAVLGPANCSVQLTGTGFGTGYTITGPNGYVFSAVYRKVGTYSINALNVKTPGTYTFIVNYINSCGQSSSDTMTYVVTGEKCN